DAAGRRFGAFAAASNVGAGFSDIYVTTFDQATPSVQGPLVPVIVPAGGVGTLQESPKIAADYSANLATQNNVYVTWESGIGGGNLIRAARSTTHASLGSFQEPTGIGAPLGGGKVAVSDAPGDLRDPDVATGPNGEIYVSWHDHGASQIKV